MAGSQSKDKKVDHTVVVVSVSSVGLDNLASSSNEEVTGSRKGRRRVEELIHKGAAPHE